MKARQTSKADPPIFIGKWAVKILFAFHESPHRYGQLQRHCAAYRTHAYQNSSQSRINGIDHEEPDRIERPWCRVLVDRVGKNIHHPAREHVPVGKTKPEGHKR
jgi:hypothetical protein